MKKQVKIISALLIVVSVLATLTNIAMATDVPGMLGTIAQGNTNANVSGVTNLGATIVTIMQTVGIVVAVVILLVLGVKYMIGSAEEKAEYKKTMIPYIVGAILIFASTTIVNIVWQIANSVGSTTV